MSDNSDIRTLNVRDFGAVGDGVADDFPAFAATFAAAQEQSTAEAPVAVFIPPGYRYRLSQTIKIKTKKPSPREKGKASNGAAD